MMRAIGMNGFIHSYTRDASENAGDPSDVFRKLGGWALRSRMSIHFHGPKL